MTKKRLHDIMVTLWLLSCFLVATNTMLSEKPVISFIATTIICSIVLVVSWKIGKNKLTE